jgi:hypothetical protein
VVIGGITPVGRIVIGWPSLFHPTDPIPALGGGAIDPASQAY